MGVTCVVGEVGLEPTKASASGFTVRPLCRSGHSPEPRIRADAWSRRVMGSALGGVNRAKSARASAENATEGLILAPPHGTLAGRRIAHAPTPSASARHAPPASARAEAQG